MNKKISSAPKKSNESNKNNQEFKKNSVNRVSNQAEVKSLQVEKNKHTAKASAPKKNETTSKKYAKRTQPAKRGILSKIVRFIFVSATLLVCWITYCFIVLVLNPYDERPQKADAAIVLGAALWNNSPSPALKERLQHAIYLYDEQLVDYIIASGGKGSSLQQFSEAEGMMEYLVQHGIPQEKIILEQHATDTYENLLFSKAVLEKHQLESVIIVSHAYHAYRANSIAKYLDYEQYQVSGVKSVVLNKYYHYTREVLAYTKWCINRLLLPMGGFI